MKIIKKIVLPIMIFSFLLILFACNESAKYYNVEFIINDKIVFVEKVRENNYSEGFIAPEIENYEFLYWQNKENNKEWLFNEYKVTKNITLVAIYEQKDTKHNKLTIFNLNDTHGAILNNPANNELGLAKIANYINKTRNNSIDNSIFIANGDILQGQLISNNNRGKVFIEIFNQLNLDAFILGNHEFDWGIDVILNYFDKDAPGDVKANFPLLAANVINKNTGQRPTNIKSHTIVQKDNLNVGIIGVIGDGLESSISALRVKDYEFTNAFLAVKDIVTKIENDVDIIVVAIHGDNNQFNESVSKLPKVEAIINAHSHQEVIAKYNNKPVIQSGSNGKMIGQIDIFYETNNNNVNIKNYHSQNIKTHEYLNESDLNVETIINKYYQEVKHLYEDEIIIAKENLSRSTLAKYISKVMKTKANAVAGFQNNGGTRADFYKGQKIKAADVLQVFPFDNQIIGVELFGRELVIMLNDSYFAKDTDIYVSEVNENNKYKIATNDYIFYYENNYYFEDYRNNNDFEILGDMYETFLEVLMNLKANGYEYFDSQSPVILN